MTGKLKQLEVAILNEVSSEDCSYGKAKVKDNLTVHYTGRLVEGGEQFETSYGGMPFEFALGTGAVIQGWDLGLAGMCIGQKRKLSIPSSLAYGPAGTGGKIGPNADIEFDVELVSINGKSAAKLKAAVKARQQEYIVSSMPNLSPKDMAKVDMRAGYIDLDSKKTVQYYHILVRKPDSPHKNLIFWFNGGPGCTSMDGMFLEVGPFRFVVDADPAQLIMNEDGWWSEGDVVFVDQPAGAGFSLGTPSRTNQEVTKNFQGFLIGFLELYPEYTLPGISMFLAGESYAGVWIPLFSKALLADGYPLKAILIGNGWIDPYYQYPSYIPYIEKYNLLPVAYKTLVHGKDAQCKKDLEPTPRHNTYSNCEDIVNIVLDASMAGGKYCMNKYDYSLRDLGPNEGCGMAWPFGLEDMKKYLVRDDVKKAMHSRRNEHLSFQECDGGVWTALADRDNEDEPSITIFPELLSKLSIILVAGERDILCNYMGIESSVQNLVWAGSTTPGFSGKFDEWESMGTKVSERNLSYYLIHNASHMFPYDVPKASRKVFQEMISSNDARMKLSTDNKISNSDGSGTTLNIAPPAGVVNNEDDLSSSKTAALLFLFSIFIVAVLGGLYVRRKLASRSSRWNAVPDEEEIELNDTSMSPSRGGHPRIRIAGPHDD